VNKAGLAILLFFSVTALLSTILASWNHQKDTDAYLEAPSARHLLGTDDVGHDIFSQLLIGSRLSLAVGLSAGLAATLIGLFAGLLAETM